MAFSFPLCPFFTFLLLLLLFPVRQTADGCYTSIFNFGDSISDTGNLLLSAGKNCLAGRFPYGETFFGHPTGRFSDGRLVVDFIAEAMGIPFLPPFMRGADGGGDRDFRRGMNFAFAGATALSKDFFRERGFVVGWTNMSLGVQVGLFKELFYFCGSECKDHFSKALILVGEIGGNDYNHAFFQNWSFPEIKSFVPQVINTIKHKHCWFPETSPLDASHHISHSSRKEDYDASTGCIKWLNEFSEYHNSYLKQELDRLRHIHPHATIIYADYFNAIMNFIKPANSTRPERMPLAACCGGGGGRYNYDASVNCGSKNSAVCDDPSAYLCWDGLHFTEVAYKAIAKGLLEGPFADPSLFKTCGSSSIEVVVKELTFNVSEVD